ncbi:MAG: DNA polymerase I [Clostridia bacterium]|nr:DNA polymerase I [Clostridia bacterium]
MKKILVIDGNSIINRAFYGVRPLTTKSGKHTNAIFGMVNIISRQLDTIKPDYAAVAFDLKAPTFRHKMYSEYKAGRHPTPEELLSQFDDAKECLRLMGLHVLELPGYEADDIQGTVANMAHTAKEETESYILSGDRDLLQLIDTKISVLLAGNNDTQLIKRDEFFAKYGIEPEEFVDMKALMGDSSDNIPGVAGVGEKTAQGLISSFGSLDGIYENIDSQEIKKGVREKLIRDKENDYLSKTLAKIDTQAPIKESLHDLKYEGLNRSELYKKFTELELNSFIAKFNITKDEEKEETLQIVNTASFNDVTSEKLVSLKGERFSLYQGRDALYLYNINVGNIRYSGEISDICEFFTDGEIVCYSGKELWHFLRKNGARPSEKLRLLDLELYAYVLNPGSGSAGLPSLSSMFLGLAIDEDEPCPEIMMRLEEKMREKINEDGLSDILDKLELPLIPILAEIEERGFKINVSAMNDFSKALSELEEELTQKIYFEAGREFNINSPKQLGEVLFVDLALPHNAKKGKTGYSTDAETLESLRPYSPIIDDILEYRQVAKLRGTYAAALPKLVDENDRIHTDFRQALTATGRLSSQDPNLQNIPIRTKMGREMRRYFIAEDGYTLVDADYSQIELRLLAHISDDYNMKESFISGADIHRKTASAVFGVPEESVNDEMRKRAKAVNFGIVYGISGFSLAKDIGTTTQEASKYIKNYLMNYPSVDSYLENVVNEAKEKGYTVTPMGRRRYIPELNAANGMLRAFGKRVAMNAPIQGAAADIMKLAMIKVDAALKAAKLDARIVMQVHDELVIEVKRENASECKEIVKREMENAVKLSIPLTVDVTEGINWLEQN